VGNGAVTHAAQAATRPTEQRNASPPQLTDIEAYVADMENCTHFEDWLKRFEMSFMCGTKHRRQRKDNGATHETQPTRSLSSGNAVYPKT